MKTNPTLPLLTLAALLLAGGCSRHSSGEAATAEQEPVEVSVTQAVTDRHSRIHWLPGTVRPSEQAIIASRLMGSVDKMNVAIGQVVRSGEILVELQADEVDAGVEQAQAALAQLERNFVREKALLEQSATTAETVRTLEDQIRLAKARLAEAQTMQIYRYIQAPFDGIITTKHVRRGDLASPGMPLLEIDGQGEREIHVQVPDSLATLPHGSPVMVESEGLSLKARLSEWSPAADPSSRTRLAKLSLADTAATRSGQYVRVGWPAGQMESVWVPVGSVVSSGQIEWVYTVEGGSARMRLIRTGMVDKDRLQILSGIEPGETIVAEPGSRLRDNQPIVVIK
ncbi:MAG: efflux RND transporter periplasmic adaptor subunit [Opitutales bacterium]